MTAELKRAIIKLKDRISESVEFKDDPNTACWGSEIGILITRNEANLIVGELEKPLPTDVQKEAWNDALKEVEALMRKPCWDLTLCEDIKKLKK